MRTAKSISLHRVVADASYGQHHDQEERPILIAAPRETARYRATGFAEIPLPQLLLSRLRAAVDADRTEWPLQEELSGLHNPFGRAAYFVDSWTLLDVAEKSELADIVAALIGPDIILWDSELYRDWTGLTAGWPHESRYWPVEPLAGLIVAVPLLKGRDRALIVNIERSPVEWPSPLDDVGPVYALRYMPATSHFNREPYFSANRLTAEQRPLVNYTNRPIWLIRGEDRASNDFVTGFAPTTLSWAASAFDTKNR
jgi:hypothetical protein